MKQKIIEVTNNNQNWGKFLLLQLTEEWEAKSNLPLCEDTPEDVRALLTHSPLMHQLGWDSRTPYLWVLDLQTGEGAFLKIGGNAHADLAKHRVWVCPMYEPFLVWLYKQDVSDIDTLPAFVDLPDAEFHLYGYRRGEA